MDRNELTFLLTCAGMVCWVVCFGWLHLISRRQNALLDQLHRQGKRIEQLSKSEHDLIQEVHPQVGEIKEDVQEVKAAVKSSQ